MTLSPGGVLSVGVSVDATKVSGPGTYTTNLIASGNFTNSSITIPVTLTVTTASSQPTIIFTASPSTIIAGQATNLTWSSTYATSCVLAGAHGYNDNGNWSKSSLTSSGSLQVIPYPSSQTQYTTQYNITCTGSGGSTTKIVIVSVVPTLAPVITKVLSPNGGEQWKIGSAQNITWNVASGVSVLVDLYKGNLYKGNVFKKRLSSGYGGYAGGSSLSITVPSDVGTGSDYTIKIQTPTLSDYDVSDAPFSIVN